MMTISRGQKLSQRLSWFKMQSAGEGGMPQRVDCSLEEVVPEAAWYLTQPSTYLGGAPGQKNTDPGNNKASCSLKERAKRAKGLCPPFRITVSLVSSR